jgi:hypothetical protein
MKCVLWPGRGAEAQRAAAARSGDIKAQAAQADAVSRCRNSQNNQAVPSSNMIHDLGM